MAEENGMWGGGYWGEGYWGDGYWGIFGAAVEAAVEAVIGVFPPLLRKRFTALIPMFVTIRRSYAFNISMSRVIRSLWRVEAVFSRVVRRSIMESFTGKRMVVTKEFKRLMKTIYEFLKEE